MVLSSGSLVAGSKASNSLSVMEDMGLSSKDHSPAPVYAVIVPRKPGQLSIKDDATVLLDTSSDSSSEVCASCPPRAAFDKQHGSLMVRAPGETATVSPFLAPDFRTIPINNPACPVALESELFSGKVVFAFRDLPSTPSSLFEGRRRRFWMGLQVQFNRPVPFDSLHFGTFFTAPVKLPTSPFLNQALMWLVNKLGGGAQAQLQGDQPYISAPLIAAAQEVHVAPIGSEPAVIGAGEDMRLFDESLCSRWSGAPLAASKRQAQFRSAAARKGRVFDTEHVWTFQIYDQVMDYSSFQLPLPFFPIEVAQVLSGQPLPVSIRDINSNTDAMRFEIWHESLLKQ